ncbi:EF-hand domain [Macleaya cordata]|uniref:EF-hand domain n=1 Tax=Macleaya cordata TaxID=56857 RepID=A0A200QIV8_MACCD|nr:EF-hand domain [Macleaya cordata]
MAIKSRSVTTHNRDVHHGANQREMTIDEFKLWLMSFDTDKDGRISKDELRKAIRSVTGWFSACKNTKKGIYADANGDGYIDDEEIYNLLDFAEERLGMKIIAY